MYTLDAVGNRTQLDEWQPLVGQPGQPVQSVTTYGYDRLSRLTSANGSGGPTTYEYDPVGNRRTMTRGSAASYTYDKADRTQQAGSVTHTINANWNLVARGSDSFAYDQANGLTSATVGGATTIYTYDAGGKRTHKWVDWWTTTSCLYDENRSLR